MEESLRALSPVVMEACQYSLLVLSALAALYGLLMLIAPEQAKGLSARLEHPLSSAGAGLLERSWRSERWFYRHHRLTGGVLVLAAGFMLAVAPGLYPPPHYPGPLADWGLASAQVFVLFAAAVAAALGAVVFVRPSALKKLEALANRSVSSKGLEAALDRSYDLVDPWVWRYPRVSGALIALGGGFVVFGLVTVFL